jgi:hypothetical protein
VGWREYFFRRTSCASIKCLKVNAELFFSTQRIYAGYFFLIQLSLLYSALAAFPLLSFALCIAHAIYPSMQPATVCLRPFRRGAAGARRDCVVHGSFVNRLPTCRVQFWFPRVRPNHYGACTTRFTLPTPSVKRTPPSIKHARPCHIRGLQT